MALLEALNLSHKFDYPLFDNVNFSLTCKDSISITGVSGSGKSTLLHICSTLLEPNAGEVKLFGRKIYELPKKELIKIRREDIGIIFQAHYLFRGFSAYENIELSTLLTNQEMDGKLFQKLKIDKILKQKVGELSGGQQQRISIARVLSKKPKIIFADEPTGNLDSQTAKEVMDILFEYIEEFDGALMLVTHDENLAKRCKQTYAISG